MFNLYRNRWIIIFIIILLTIILFPYNILNGVTFQRFELNTKLYNELGDFIGGITAPLLSILALFLLYRTYKSQKEELLETRLLLQKQTEYLNKQQFEATFFNMLNLHHTIVNSIDLIKKPKIEKLTPKDIGDFSSRQKEIGRDCFKTFYNGLTTLYNKTKNELEVTRVKIAYDNYLKLHQSDLGHYYRNLYHTIKLVKRADIQNKFDYIGLVRAQLSQHEQLMLFYNGLSTKGFKFKCLIEEFHLLHNLDTEDLLNRSHKDLYKKSAYNNQS